MQNNIITLQELPKIFDLDDFYFDDKKQMVVIRGGGCNHINYKSIDFILEITAKEFELMADKHGHALVGCDEYYRDGIECRGAGVRELNVYELIEGEDALTLGEVEELLNKARK